jgi:SAM-dependent methyltransferase
MVVSAEALHNCIRDQDRNGSLKPKPNYEKGARSLFGGLCAGKKMTPTAASVNPNKALWEKGDFTEIAAFMRHSGEAVVKTLGVSPEMRVLDLGCGDGTTALPLARTGAEVTGIDIARNLVAAGNKRAQEAGLTRLKFQEGDACKLEGVPDNSFDLSISLFGAMFAPNPFEVAKELVRVTRHGGRIVMGNWIPGDPTFVSQVLRISSAFTPPPPEGFISPMTWGVEANIVERFTNAGIPRENISLMKDTFYFASPDQNPTRFIELFRDFYGPTMNAYEAARKNGKEGELHAQLVELAMAQNKSDVGTLIPATFMRVTVRV